MVALIEKPKSGFLENVVEVRCIETRNYRGEDHKCGSLILRLTPDLMDVVAEFEVEHGRSIDWYCDRCRKYVDVEVRLE